MKIKDLQLKRALRSVLLFLLLSVAGMAKGQSRNYDFSEVCPSGQTLYYRIIDYDNYYVALTCPTASWTGFIKPSGDIILSSSVIYDGVYYSVTEIDGYAFAECSGVSSITIPNSVIRIGDYAFHYCEGLGSVSIPESSVTEIGECAFDFCTNLWGFSIPASVTKIGTSAFYGCQSLYDFSIPESVTEIGNNAFTATGWFVNQPDGVLYTSNCCVGIKGELGGHLDLGFWDEEPKYPRLICNEFLHNLGGVTSLTIPSSVTSIGDKAFAFCDFTEVHFNATNCINVICKGYDSPFTECDGTLTIGENVERIPENIFKFNNFTGTLIIPNSVTSIGEKAFYESHSFTGSLTIPSSVTTIGKEAFYFCNTFTGNLTIMNPMTEIGESAFSLCSGFTGDLTIPNSIGKGAFSNCYGFDGILTIPTSVTNIGEFAFAECSGFAEVHFNASYATVDVPGSGMYYYSPFKDCNGILVIGEEVKKLSERTFYQCHFTEIHYNAINHLHVPEYSFWGHPNPFNDCSCSSKLEIGENVQRIPSLMFNESHFSGDLVILSTSLIGIYEAFPGSTFSAVYYAGDISQWCNMYFDNSGLGTHKLYINNNELVTDLVIPETVTQIRPYTFSGTSSLTSLTIPNTMTSIGNNAFSSCNGLKTISSLAETPPTLGNNVFFSYNPPDRQLYVPCGSADDYSSAEGWNIFSGIFGMCSGTVSVTINPTEGGTVVGAGDYEGGETCTLIATPSSDYLFINWTENDMVVSTDLVYTFPAHPTTIVANFYSNEPIVFADANVKALCVANWDKNDDGELGYAEASLVTDLQDVFTNNAEITSFEELQYFIGLTSIGYAAFSGCSELTSIIIPNSVTSIGYAAFSGCSELASIIIPNSVTGIGSFAFSGCGGITNLVLGNSITSIGFGTFSDCSGLTGDLVIPNSVTWIDNLAFSGCSGITNLVLGNSLTNIGSGAFSDCSGLTNDVVIPNSVTWIDCGAFENCNITVFIMMATTPPELPYEDDCYYEDYGEVFPSSNPNFTIYVPYEFLNVYKTAENWDVYEPYIKPMFAPSIIGYASSTSNDKWTFIALPLAEDTDPAAVLNLLSEDHDYDLYQYDQSAEGEEWRNYKVDSFNLVNGRGYLYATAVDLNLIIGGEFNEDDTKEVSLDYDAGKTNAGWNLVGNPFPVDAYLNRSYYVMNASGSGLLLLPISASTPIPPCTGVFVRAEGEGETVIFTRAEP